MKWGPMLGVLAALLLMSVYEWPKITRRKEKITFIALTAMGFVLSLLLIHYPELPGPTQMLISVFKPLGKFLEK